MIFNHDDTHPSVTAEDTAPGAPDSPAVPAEDGIREPLTDSAASADMTATAEAMRAAAAEGRDFAARNRSEAQELMEAARAKVARIMTGAEAAARELGTAADQRGREAHDLSQRAGWLDMAAGIQDQAAKADAAAADLQDEHERLTGQLGDLGPRIARILSEREEVTGQLADAQARADVDRATHLSARLKGIDGVLGNLNGQHDALTARLAALGDAGGGLIGEAAGTARSHHSHVHRILGDVWPGSDEAVRDRAVAELRGALEANLTRIADEQRRAQQPQRQQVVRGRG